MFGSVFRFELRYRLRQPVVYVFAAFMFFLAFMPIATDSAGVGDSIGNTARNAPYVVINLFASLGVIGLIVLAVFVASAVNRDRVLEIHELFFSTPLDKVSYLTGRFAGSVVLAFITMIPAAVGIWFASVMPWQDPEHLVAFRLLPYAYALGVFALPNLFFIGAIFFAIATLSRRGFFAYVALVALVTLRISSQAFLANLENTLLAALLDPFGFMSFRLTTRYWTVVEQNSMVPPLAGHLLLNRLLWMAIGLGFLLFTLIRFRMGVDRRSATPRRVRRQEEEEEAAPEPIVASMPDVRATFTGRTLFRQWRCQTLSEVGGVLRSIPFVVIMALGVFNLVTILFADAGIYQSGAAPSTTSHALTRLMLFTIGTLKPFMFIVIVIYSAEMVWRERQAKTHELFGALPVPNWVPLTAKLTALAVISVAALTAAMLTTMVFQISRGHFNFELGLYLKALFVISLSEWLLLCVLALFVQVLANQEYIGYLVMVLYFIAMQALPGMGYEHHLYLYGTTPEAPYSDLNGYGHFGKPLLWFNLYWGLLAAALMLLANLLWIRGTDDRMRLRLRLARERMTRIHVTGLAGAAIAFVLVGGWIFYNTNTLNKYRTSEEENRLAVLYEQRYKQYDSLSQPKLTDVKLKVDIYPMLRRADIRGHLHLVNKTDETIEKLHVRLNKDLEINAFSLADDALEVDDREVGYRIYKLAEPLAPGAPLDASFDVSLITYGFVNNGSNVAIVENGTFLDSFAYVPGVGYNREGELEDPDDRKQYGLPPRARAAPVDDIEARRKLPYSNGADRITFEATVSTSLDQIAIAPGYLQREWTENGRRYFHYKMDAPIVNYYAFLSGRWEVKTDKWHDVDVAVYYHKAHAYNVDRMIDAVKKTLDYCTTNFSPYQHHQVRIIEFPGYRSFAQSFSNTIPFSESLHFIDDPRDEGDIDVAFYITAHEVAHQWWGHQVCPGNVQGWSMLVESMAQYTALMVQEKEYGRDEIKKFLAHDLDLYLRGRTRERIDEIPLMLVENQPYIHYRKGGLVTYAVRDYIGEEAFNAALRKFVKATAYQDPPYTNSLELLDHVREVMPDHLQYLIEDMFETITLYDNRAEEATFTRTDEGKYKVRLAYRSRKMRADGQGTETEIEYNDWIEIGVFGESWVSGKSIETTLYLEKHRLVAGEHEIEVTVDEEPVRAGIDPRNLLIDRIPGDNVKRISG
ncbi:MAG: ABC transporter permease/M1 family aminopeptidase [Planctomycetota bacterium]|jgi:ABC-type transport system involved in multi-copper enzyme maturation permease subunit